METVNTAYGPISASGIVERFSDGSVKSCTPAAECTFATAVGPLVPQYSTDDVRRRTVQALGFYENGVVRHMPLERPTVIATPAGRIGVELVTFYENGALHRAFPLNGKLSGFWSETDEGALAQPMAVETPVGVLTARLISVNFAPGGELLSLTLWPGETLRVPTPAGVLEARIGVSFRPDGTLRSLEPATPQPVTTPAGSLLAFDPDAVGICGDVNSLVFAPNGAIERASTNLTGLAAACADGRNITIEPELRESICGENEREVTPLRLKFGEKNISVQPRPAAEWLNLPLSRWDVRTRPFVPQFVRSPARHVCTA